MDIDPYDDAGGAWRLPLSETNKASPLKSYPSPRHALLRHHETSPFVTAHREGDALDACGTLAPDLAVAPGEGGTA